MRLHRRVRIKIVLTLRGALFPSRLPRKEGAVSGLCNVGMALAMKDSCGKIITLKHLLGVDVEALGEVPWANDFVWFLIGLFALMLLGAIQQKKGR
jgi:hypothetical protein